MVSKEEATQLRKQVIGQINSTFPEDKKQEAISQIESMNDEQFEEFLKQNKLIPEQGSPQKQQCVFCSIISGDIASHIIQEHQEATAILEINPISKGHIILIPRIHSEKIPETINPLAQEISERIKSKLKPKSITIAPSSLFGHEVLNIIPVYENETIDSQRQKAKTEDLAELQNLLEKKKEPEKIEKPKTETLDGKNLWLPRRIP